MYRFLSEIRGDPITTLVNFWRLLLNLLEVFRRVLNFEELWARNILLNCLTLPSLKISDFWNGHIIFMYFKVFLSVRDLVKIILFVSLCTKVYCTPVMLYVLFIALHRKMWMIGIAFSQCYDTIIAKKSVEHVVSGFLKK